MRLLKTYITIFASLALLFILQGCIDNPISGNESTIKGNIYGDIPFGIYLVSAGNYPITSTNRDGSFETYALDYPYDLTVTEFDPYFNYSRIVSKFTGVTQTKPQVVFDFFRIAYFTPQGYEKACNLGIHFPKISELKNIFYKFVSTDDFLQLNYRALTELYTDFVSTQIYIPVNKNSISGKLYFLEASYNYENGFIISYDKLGVKDVTLSYENNSEIRFTEKDLSFNPEDIEVPVNIYYFNPFSHNYTTINLQIELEQKKHDFAVEQFQGNEGNVILPLLKNSEFKITTQSHYNVFSESGFEKNLFDIGEPININHKESIQIIKPMNNSENITDTSYFQISDNDEPAIYQFTLLYNNILRYYTSNKTVKFSEFKSRMFDLEKNKTYVWLIKKYPGYNSIDEFVQKPYIYDNRYEYIELSNMQSFKTAP